MVLSPDLFNLILEVVMSLALSNAEEGVSIGGRRPNNLRFADDIDLVAESKPQLQELTKKVDSSSKRLGLRINAQKTKTITVGKNRRHWTSDWEERSWNK